MNGFNHLEVTVGQSTLVVSVLLAILTVALLSISLTPLFSGVVYYMMLFGCCYYAGITYKSYINTHIGSKLTWNPDADELHLTDLKGKVRRFTKIQRISHHQVWIYLVLDNEEGQVNLLLPIDSMPSSDFRRLSVMCRYIK